MAVCPYCDIEVTEQQIESEDGCCPECGAFITLSDGEYLFGDAEAADDFEEPEFDEELEDFDEEEY